MQTICCVIYSMADDEVALANKGNVSYSYDYTDLLVLNGYVN